MDRLLNASDVKRLSPYTKSHELQLVAFSIPFLYRGGLKPLGWLPTITVQPFADIIGYYTANDREDK